MPKPNFPPPTSVLCTVVGMKHNWSLTGGRLANDGTLEYSYHVCRICGLYELFDF